MTTVHCLLRALPVFANMTQQIKIQGPVKCNSMPPGLLTSTSALHQSKREGAVTDNEHSKRQRTSDKKTAPSNKGETSRDDIYNPKMAAAMAPFLAMPIRPTITRLCNICNTQALDLFPNNNSLCVRSQIYGACNVNCRNTHTKVTEAEIDFVLKKLEKVIKKSIFGE